MCKLQLVLVFCVFLCCCSAYPSRKTRQLVIIPADRTSASAAAQYGNPYVQSRGPLEFIAGWLQSTGWFPIVVNVPEVIGNIGNGIQSGITNIGNGITTFGDGVSNAAGNFIQGIPFINNLMGGNSQTSKPMRYIVIVPTQKLQNRNHLIYNSPKIAPHGNGGNNQIPIDFDPFHNEIQNDLPFP